MVARGIRNNNPGNIEYNPGVPWQGLDNPPSDGRFCRFKTAPYGIRALCRVLITYQDKHDVRTVRKIINRWAPPNENNTDSYVNAVSGAVGVTPDHKLNVHDFDTLSKLVQAIIRHENGSQPYTEGQITKGLVLAGVEPIEKPLSQSRTVKGGKIAAVASGTIPLLDVVDAAHSATPLIELMGKYGPPVLAAIALVAVGYMLWARYDDRRKGLR